jgi:hypothetical protein
VGVVRKAISTITSSSPISSQQRANEPLTTFQFLHTRYSLWCSCTALGCSILLLWAASHMTKVCYLASCKTNHFTTVKSILHVQVLSTAYTFMAACMHSALLYHVHKTLQAISLCRHDTVM